MNNKRRHIKMVCLTSVAVLLGACSSTPEVKPSKPIGVQASMQPPPVLSLPMPKMVKQPTASTNYATPAATQPPVVSLPMPKVVKQATAYTNYATPINTSYTTPATTSNSNTGGAGTHIVKKGDTVFEVMRQTGVNWKEIISMNNLQPPYTIHPGQSLRLM